MRRTTMLAAAAVVSLALAGCGSSSKTGGSTGNIVQLAITDAGCPAKLEQPAGPTTFEVTNDGADDVSEFEILDGSRVLGEVENLTPGLSGSFSLTLKPGTFTTACPGGKTHARGELVVSGDDAAGVTTTRAQDAAGQKAVTTYRTYVEHEAQQLVTELEPAQIVNGAVELLNEVASSKVTGEEDRYSHTDLWDFEANLEAPSRRSAR